VTGGTKVLSDRIKVVVTTVPGESFLDKMIALVEGASRQKTPNEIALTSCWPVSPRLHHRHRHPQALRRLRANAHHHRRADFPVRLPDPDHHRRFVVGHRYCRHGPCPAGQCDCQSGKAVETAGDLDTLLLDKTGTITIGNRKATHFYPATAWTRKPFCAAMRCAQLPGRRNSRRKIHRGTRRPIDKSPSSS
jgi:K+-transporting ATPase ATPase B chain